MEAIKLRFKYTQEEYVKAERQILFGNKTITKPSVVILPICILFAIWYLFSSEFSALSIIVLVLAVFALLAGTILYFYIPRLKFKSTSKYHEEYQLLFSEEGIRFRTPTINSELKWDVYASFWESDDFYYLMQTSRIYSLIPKRVFADTETRLDFEDMVLSHLDCTKRVIGK